MAVDDRTDSKPDREYLRVGKAALKRALFPDREYVEFDISDREIECARRLTELLARLHRLYAGEGQPLNSVCGELLQELIAAARSAGHAQGWRERGQMAYVELEGFDEHARIKRRRRKRSRES